MTQAATSPNENSLMCLNAESMFLNWRKIVLSFICLKVYRACNHLLRNGFRQFHFLLIGLSQLHWLGWMRN